MVSCLVELSFHAAEGLSTRQEHVHGKQHLHPGKRDKFNQNFLKNLCHGWIVHFFFFFDYLTIIGRRWAKYRDLSAASRSVICRSRKLRQIINLQDTCCGWGPCFLVSRPFRSRDELFFLFFFFYCTKSLDISYWSDSHEVTTFERLTTYIYPCLYGLAGLVRRIYTLVCTDWFALSELSVNASLRVDLHLTVSSFCCWTVGSIESCQSVWCLRFVEFVDEVSISS